MRNNQSGSKGGKGYYIALVLCAAAIGITSYVTRSSHKPEPEKISLMEQTPEAATEAAETQAVEALATEAPETEPSKAPSVPAKTPTQETQPKKLKTAAPLSGNVTTLYAMENLSYNETTRDWRTHNGVDYACTQGAAVAAPVAGKVVSAGAEGNWGTVVVLEDAAGRFWRLCGVADPAVKAGDTVAAGQKLGTVGTVGCECAEESHIHVEVKQGESYLDPAKLPE